MRILKALGLGVMALAALGLMLLAVFYPDVGRLIVGLFRVRLWSGGLVVSGILAVIAMLLATRFGRKRAGVFCVAVATLALGAALGFWAHAPDYQLESVSYPSLGVELKGELYLPAIHPAASQAPSSAVVLVHGSAPFARAFYDLWADFLASNGVAVLLVDKRGVADSGGEFVSNNNGSLENLSLLADDVVAGVDFLEARPEIDRDRIGLYGISQGGWVGLLATGKTGDIHFVVMNSGPTVSVGEEGVWSRLRGDDVDVATMSLSDAESEILNTTPSGYDPRADLAALEVPGLWLFGNQDNSIPSGKSVQVLAGFMTDGKNFSHRTYDGVGHLLIGGPDSNAPLRIVGESWDDTVDWLKGLPIRPTTSP